MNAFLFYTLKASIYLTAFYVVYYLLLSRDTAYGRNRAFIMISLLASLVLPFITLHTLRPHNIQFFGKFLSEVFITGESALPGSSISLTLAEKSIQALFIVYITGFCIVFLKLLYDLLNLTFLILRKRGNDSRIIVFHGFNTSGFSAMGYIFVNSNLSKEEANDIIRHEQNHINQNHFIDILFIEIIIVQQWYNPVIYLFNRSLRAVHEYQADQDCLSSGINVLKYQSLLLNQVFSSKIFNLTNSFSNPSLVKKRILMMTKKRTSAIASIKILSIIPVIFLILMAISAYREIPSSTSIDTNKKVPLISSEQLPPPQNISESMEAPKDGKTIEKDVISTSVASEKVTDPIPQPPPPPPPKLAVDVVKNSGNNVAEKVEEEVPFVVVEEMPSFPGGDAALLKYIGKNTHYPGKSKQDGTQGRVIVKFCVASNGSVNQISILKSVSPELDKEALRVVSSLPTFKPGRQGGKPVPVWYMVPISFTLK
jgi:TonB family protein